MPFPHKAFDYAIPTYLATSVRTGQLVSIRFRKSPVQGIIWQVELSSENSESIKPLDGLIKESIYVSEEQRAFFEWFAKRHIVSLPTACATFVPRQPQRKKHTHRKKSGHAPHFSDARIELKHNGEEIIIAQNWNIIINVIRSSCDQLLPDKQLLILSPSLHDIQMIESVLAPYCNRMVIATGVESASSLANSYDSLAEGLCDIVLSTRLALGWNLPRLQRILIIDPESRDYKQYDHNPRYDARTLADYWVQERKCSLTIISSSPSCESVERLENNVSIRIPDAREYPPLPVIDLSAEFRGGNRSFISDRLTEQIAKTRTNGKHALLYINKKGYGGSVRCSSCLDIALCTECSLPMRISLRTNMLRCASCTATRALNAACPRCQSHDFDFGGIGAERIVLSLLNRFSDASIVEITADVTSSELAETSIIIATSHLFSFYWPWIERVGCIGIIGADPVHSLIDFRSSEYQWQTIMKLIRLGDTFDLPIILQAFNSSSIFVTTLTTRDRLRFAKQQSEERKRFQWPPYGRVIKILARHHTLVHKESVDQLILSAREALASLKDSVSIFRTRSMHYESRPYILIRVNGSYVPLDPLPRELQQFLESISSDWLIDIDPVTF